MRPSFSSGASWDDASDVAAASSSAPSWTGSRPSSSSAEPRIPAKTGSSVPVEGVDESWGQAQYVLDFVDALWQIPLNAAERRYFCGRLRGEYLCYHRTPQGSRNGPFGWAITASMACRHAQSLFLFPGRSRKTKRRFSLRVQCYVDDPVASTRGSRSYRRNNVGVLILAWMLMGFALSFEKSQSGSEFEWIGSCIRVEDGQVIAEITEKRIEELRGLVDDILCGNVISQKHLRSFAGKSSYVAGVVTTWRPFVAEVWAALQTVGQQGAPTNCVRTKQVAPALSWLKAFLDPSRSSSLVEGCGLRRVWRLDSYLGLGPIVAITLDASPFGLGGVISLDGIYTGWFADRVSDDDLRILGITRDPSDGQQALEALCVLVALRIWKPAWTESRARLRVLGDNSGGLTLLLEFKVRGCLEWGTRSRMPSPDAIRLDAFGRFRRLWRICRKPFCLEETRVSTV